MSNRLRLILSSGGLVTFFLCVRSASRCLMYSCVRLRVAMLARPEFDERGASAADTVWSGRVSRTPPALYALP